MRLLILLLSFFFAGSVLAQGNMLPAQSAPYSAFEWLSRQPSNGGASQRVSIALPGTSQHVPVDRTNLSGWSPAGNYGVNNQGTYGPTIGGHAEVPIGSSKAPIDIKIPTTAAAIAKSAGMVLGNAARIGAPLVGAYTTAVAIKDVLEAAEIYFSPDLFTPEKPLYKLIKTQVCSSEGPNGATHPYANDPNFSSTWTTRRDQYGACVGGFLLTCSAYNWCPMFYPVRHVEESQYMGEKRPLTPEEVTDLIAQQQARTDFLQDLINQDKEHKRRNGVNPFGYVEPTVDVGTPTITGPSSIPGPQKTRTEDIIVQSGTNTPAAPGVPGDPGKRVTVTSTTQKITYEGDKISYTTVTNTVTNITNNVTNITTTDGGPTEETDKPEDPEEDAPTDSPLGEVPKLYERKYPDGLVGIWNQKSEIIKQSSAFTLASQLMPTTLTAGTCPSWNINLEFSWWSSYGEHNVAPPCWIWDVAKGIIIISALMLARSLIFGG